MKKYIAAYKDARLSKKIICNISPVIGLLFYFLVICRFSAQDADASGGLSLSVAKSIAGFVLSFKKEHTISDVVSLAGYFEHPLRKLAHFIEYALLGGFFGGAFIPIAGNLRKLTDNGRLRGLYIFNVLFVMVLAACDEYHQYFVPGRYASFWDVILDTFGCIICVYVLYRIFDRKKYLKENNSNENVRIRRTRTHRRFTRKSS